MQITWESYTAETCSCAPGYATAYIRMCVVQLAWWSWSSSDHHVGATMIYAVEFRATPSVRTVNAVVVTHPHAGENDKRERLKRTAHSVNTQTRKEKN